MSSSSLGIDLVFNKPTFLPKPNPHTKRAAMLFSFQIPFFLFLNICFALDIESEAERKWSSLDKTPEPKFDLISPYVDEYLRLK